jgi:hypothetical protein
VAGYSKTPLYGKLGIKAGSKLLLVNAPDGFERTLGELPPGVTITVRPRDATDIALLFTKGRSDLAKRFAALANLVAPAGSLWVSWPKKTSGVKTDLDENVVREVGLAAGLVDVKVCAVDDVWSGLKFVYRLKDRLTFGPRSHIPLRDRGARRTVQADRTGPPVQVRRGRRCEQISVARCRSPSWRRRDSSWDAAAVEARAKVRSPGLGAPREGTSAPADRITPAGAA